VTLVDEAHRLEQPGLVVGAADGIADSALYIEIDPAPATQLVDERLRLAGIASGQVGMARLNATEASWRLAADGIFAMPPDTRPTPTISGMIELILAEARYTQKRRGAAG
jgi:hypothetical protein